MHYHWVPLVAVDQLVGLAWNESDQTMILNWSKLLKGTHLKMKPLLDVNEPLQLKTWL
jgi:hypothetical protein